MIQLLCLPILLLHSKLPQSRVKINRDAPRSINVWVSRDVAPSSKIRININTRNLPFVYVTTFPIDGVKWLTHPSHQNVRPQPDGHELSHYTLSIERHGQRISPIDNYFSRQVNLPKMKPGVYLINFGAGGKEAWAVVNVTSMSLVVKRSPYRSLCWVTDYKTGSGIKGAEVNYYNLNGNLISNGVTGNDGTSFLKIPPCETTVIVRYKHDLATVRSSSEDPNGKLRCLFQTDRPIYRPGQIVHFKAILRLTDNLIYRRVLNTFVKVELRDPRDNPLDQKTIPVNNMGSVASEFKIPEEGLDGAYTLVLTVDNQQAYQTFTVASYRKPEFKIEVSPVNNYYLAGQDIHFKVNAQYYFGAPVGQAQIHWIVRRNDNPYSWNSGDDQWFYGGDGNLYPSNTYRYAPFTGEGDVVTTNKGLADVTIHTDPHAPDSTYSISLTVTDSSRRQVQSSATVPVYMSKMRIGLESLKQTVAIGGLTPIVVKVINIKGEPQPAKVKLQETTQVWDHKTHTYVEKLLTTKTVQVPSSGQLTVNLPALAYGELDVHASAKDDTGRSTSADSSFWSASLNYKPDKEVVQPTLNIKLDKQNYEPGEKVRTFVITNRPHRPILIVLEGGDIWSYKVLDPKSNLVEWRFETNSKESPNAYVTASQWTETGLISGNAIVPLPDKSKLLKVIVKPNRAAYRPGDKATIHIETLNSKGVGVQSEVALAVIDEAIYALSPDITPNPYLFFWGKRSNNVISFQSSPEQLSGGAYQQSNSAAPVRQQFKDTAFWQAIIDTDRHGNADVSFDMPGNLTDWRATARAITTDTRVGSNKVDIVATRPITLRLATPRIMVQGDLLSLIGTVNNRSDQALDFNVKLATQGVDVIGPAKIRLHLDANSEKTVTWQIKANTVPTTGFCTLLGEANAIGKSGSDYGDALLVKLPIVPRGLTESTILGGTIKQDISPALTLPSDTLSEGSLIKVSIAGGMKAKVHDCAMQIFTNGRYGTMWAVDALKSATSINAPANGDTVKEAFALLSRDQGSDGWGWWQNAPVSAKITAEVGYALSLAENQGYTVYPNIKNFITGACRSQYSQTNLWEDRARIAASLVLLGDKQSAGFVKEVVTRGEKISPFAKLRLAEALISSDRSQAQKYLESVLPLVSEGTTDAYVPVGSGIGWSASQTETTAELLITLDKMDENTQLQTKLATWLAVPKEGNYESEDDSAETIIALSLYGKQHPDAKRIGDATVTINGKSYPLVPSTVDKSSSVTIRDFILHGGSNAIQIHRDGDGEALYDVQISYYRPVLKESIHGVRVVRRYEVMNDAGVWQEVNGVIKPNEPVRCTVVIWGDNIPDALKVTEPIPAGFEFVDSDYTSDALEDVRDGAVIHYLLNSGIPTYFRYYLRAESDGRLSALPASCEYLRRPSVRGNSAGMELVVHP